MSSRLATSGWKWVAFETVSRFVKTARCLRRVVGLRARHDEDVLARADVVVGRAGLGVAAVATRGLVLGGLVRVAGLDLGELDRVLAEPVELLVLALVAPPTASPARPARAGSCTACGRAAGWDALEEAFT